MSKAGFTLFEVVLTTTLIAIVAAMTTPPMVTAYRQRVTQGAASRFEGAHMLARSTALRYGRVAELHIDAAGARFWVEVDTTRAGTARDTVGLVHNVGGSGLAMSSNRSIVCFDGRGLATSRGACQPADVTVAFALSGRADTVRSTALGKVLR